MGIGICLLSVGDVFLKILSSTYSPFHVLLMRSLIALPFLLLLLKKKQNLSNIFQVNVKAQILRNGALSLSLLLRIYSLSLLPLAEYSVLFCSGPFFMALLAIPLLGETVSKTHWMCILAGLGGVIIALNPSPHHMIQSGGITTLIAAFLYGIGVVLTSKLGRKTSSLVQTIWHAMTCTVVSLCGALFIPFSFLLSDLPYFLAAGLIYIVANVTITESFKLAPTSYTAPLNYTSILWASLFGYLLWNQWPEANLIAGAILIVGSGIVMISDDRKKDKTTALEAQVEVE